jgi:hypothetical protein
LESGEFDGTAWEVPEGPAKLFAEVFYTALFQSGDTLGAAVKAARNALYARRTEWGEFGTVWGAYQHYGDPTRRLID